MSDFPTLSEEINRKAFETIQKLSFDFRNGNITEGQFKYGVDIAWSILAGLVDTDCIAMFGELGDMSKSISYSERHVFRNNDGSLVLIIDSKQGSLAYKIWDKDGNVKSKTISYKDEPNPRLLAKYKIEALMNSLYKTGYIKIV